MSRKTVEYQGIFDVSNIISGLKQIRTEMDKNVSANGKGALGDIDKQLAALQKQSSSLFTALEKGFSSTSEAKAFEKEVGKLHQNLLQVKNNLQGIARTEISTNTKEYQKQIAQVEKQIKQLKNNALNDLIKTLKTSKLSGKENLEMLAREGKLTKDVIQSEIDKRTESIKQQKEELEIIKEKAKQEALNNAATKAVGKKGLGTLVNDENLANNFKYRSNAYKDYDNSIRAKNDRGNYVQKFTPDAGAVINEEYRKALVDAVNTGKTGTEAFNAFAAAMARYNVVVTNSKEIQARMGQQLENSNRVYGESVDKINNLNTSELKEVQAAEKNIEKLEQEQQAYQILNGAIDTYNGKITEADSKMDNFTSSTTQTNNALEGLSSQANGIGENISNWAEGANTAAEGLSNTTEQQQKLNSAFDSLKGRIAMLLSIGNIFYKIRSEVINTYNDIRLLDQAFGQIAMVTDFSIEDMWEKYDAYAKIANELGQSTLSVVQASGLYFQQGLEEAEALELTTSTMKLATLAGLDFEQATSLMTSAVRGFHMEMSEGEHVTDVYSELAAHAAASVDQIATAMSRTSAIANSAGMEFETTSAMLTTMIEATQESPETLGTAMKTVVARFTELKENVSQVDSEFDDLDYNKVDKALKSIGVSLKDTNGQFRDIDEVFLEVAKKWDTLDRNSQRYVATIAAGSRQQSRFISLMENYDRTLELIDVAQDSAGKSSEQFAKYQDTLENKIKRLQNSWEQLKLSFLNDNVFKGAVDGLNSFIGTLEKMSGKQLVGFSALGVVIAKSLVSNVTKGLKNESTKLSKAWTDVLTKAYEEKANISVEKYTNKLKEAETEQDNLNNKLTNQYNTLNRVNQEYKEQQMETRAQEVGLATINADIEEQVNEGKEINADLEKRRHSLEVELEKQKQIEQEVQNRLNEEKLITQELEQQKNKQDKKVVNLQGKINTAQGNPSEKAKATREMTSLIGSAVSSGIFVGITTFLASKDAKTALLAAGGTLLASVGPILLEKAIVAGLSKLAGSAIITAAMPVITAAVPVLIGAAAVAAIAGVAGYLAWYNSEEQKLKRKIKEDKEELARLSEQSSEREDKADKANKEYNDLDTLYTKWKELNNIKIKSTKQQEELNNLNDELAEKYPDLVENYNAETHELELQTDLLEEQLKKLKEKKLLTEQESIQTNARAAAQEIELKTDKTIEKRDKKEKKLNNILGNTTSYEPYQLNIEEVKEYLEDQNLLKEALKSDSLYTNLTLQRFLLDRRVDINDIDKVVETLEKTKKEYEDTSNEITDLNKEIANSEKDKWDAILNTSEESLKKYYEDTESANAAIDIARKEAEKGKENLANLSTEDKNLAAQSYKNVSGYTTYDMFNEFGTGTIKDFDFTKDGQKDFIKVLADYNNMNLKDYQEYVKNSKLTWNQLWEDYKEAIIAGYMPTKTQEILDNISEEEAANYNDFIASLTGLSGEELRKALKEDKLINLGIPQELINEAQEAVSRQISENRKQRFKLSDILGIDIDADSFSGEVSNTINNAFKQIAEYNKDPEQYLKEIGTLFNEAGLNSSQIAQALQIDFTDVDLLNLEGFKEESIELLKSIGVEGAEELFDSWLTTAQEYSLYDPFISLSDIGEEGGLSEQFTKESDAIKGIISDLNTWVKDAGVGGIVEVDDIDKIKEIGDALGVDTSEMYKFDEATGKWKLNVKDVYNLVLNNSKKYLNLIDDSIAHYEELNKTATPEEKEQNNIQIDALKEFRKEIEETQNSINAQTDDYEDLTGVANNFNNGLKTLISTYKTLSEEQLENGHVSADSIASLEETLKSINSIAKNFKNFKVLDASAFLKHQGDSIVFTQNKLENYIDEMIKAAEKTLDFGDACDILSYYQLVALKESFHETAEQIEKDNKEKIQSAYEEWQNALDTVTEKEEALAEAQQEVIEKEEELIEKQEELQKIYYGEENHKNQNDYLYNYNIELEQLEQNAKKAKEALDDLKPGDDVHQKVQDYVTALRNEVTNYKAQNEIIKQYMENQKRMLDEGLSQRLEQLKAEGAVDTSTNVSDFYYERNGRFYIDYSKLNAAKLPDDVSDFIEQQVENLNKYGEAYESNLDKIETAQKEFLDWQKAARDKQIATENKVIEILKKKDQEELDNLKEKYDGMKTADDDYTSALEESIKKQRDLRNQANQWDDLAEKEKKLSLQQRDTSGANAKEIKKTQEDISKTRESLLDSAVDNIINNLKELYEEQEETRQAEIEYRQAILDNKNYVDEATAIINNWGSVEEAKAWFMKFDEEFINASDATIAKLLEDYEGYYNNTVEYTEAMGISYEDITNQTAEEIEEKVRETSETLTSESERALDETMDKVHEAQEKGREEVEEAKKAVEDAKNKVVEATRAVAEALEEARKKQEAYNEAIRNQPPTTEPTDIMPNPDNDPNNPDSRNYDVKQLIGQYFAAHPPIKSTLIQDVLDWVKQGNGSATVNDIIDYLKVSGNRHGYWDGASIYYTSNIPQWAINKGQTFLTGGLVDYTGPAWVDGTPSKPEAFLSASDTEMIREFIDLQKLTFTRPSTDSFTRTNNYGDPVFNIDINVDSISSDYDVDRLVERVHEDILSITSAPGQSVILSK